MYLQKGLHFLVWLRFWDRLSPVQLTLVLRRSKFPEVCLTCTKLIFISSCKGYFAWNTESEPWDRHNPNTTPEFGYGAQQFWRISFSICIGKDLHRYNNHTNANIHNIASVMTYITVSKETGQKSFAAMQPSIYFESFCSHLLTSFIGARRQRHLPLLAVTH